MSTILKQMQNVSFNPFQVAEVASLGQKQWETVCRETPPGDDNDDDECMVVMMYVMMMMMIIWCKTIVE